MRNLLVYPITKAEALETLDTLSKEYAERQLIGGTRGVILGKIRELVVAKTTDDDFK